MHTLTLWTPSVVERHRMAKTPERKEADSSKPDDSCLIETDQASRRRRVEFSLKYTVVLIVFSGCRIRLRDFRYRIQCGFCSFSCSLPFRRIISNRWCFWQSASHLWIGRHTTSCLISDISCIMMWSRQLSWWSVELFINGKVAGPIHSRSDGRIFFSTMNFLCWLSTGVRSTPMLTLLKDPSHSAKNAGYSQKRIHPWPNELRVG